MRLADIAQIKTGLVLSRKKAEIEYEARAEYKLLSLKNISEDGLIINGSYDEFISNDVLDTHYFSEENDVLMRLSQPYTAVYIDKEHAGLLIPSYFAIIKLIDTKVLPQYIAWYLNSMKVKKELTRSQAGSRIPSTNQHVIGNIPIVISPISTQRRIIELYQLHQKQKRLYKRLLDEKEAYFHAIVEQILKKGESKNG